MKKLSQIAKKATTLSELMEGRELIENKDIIKYFEKGVHVTDFDKVVKNDGEFFYVYTIAEDPKKFAFSGTVLNKIFSAIEEEYSDKKGELYAQLRNGELQVRLYEALTKEGEEYIGVEVIE